jgi:ParB family chromosome partitioning protein
MNNLHLTQAELAQKIGKSRSHVTNTLGLLSLPDEVQKLLLTSQISMGHARALSKLENEKKIIKLAHLIIEKQLSVRQIEELTMIEEKTNKIKRERTTHYLDAEQKLSQSYGSKIRIDDKKIVIYVSDENREKTIERLLKP